MAGALALRMTPDKIKAMEAVIDQCSLQHMDGASQFEAMFKMAAGMRELRTLITEDAMKDVMELQNTSLGFRTDKAQGGYPVDIVKDCVIEASLRGLRPVGNEFNIISGRMYVTKEGFSRLVREFPNLTDLKLSPSVPKMKEGGAIVEFKATWRINGAADELSREFPVRVNNGMGADAIIGKATRKMLAAVYGQLTGSEHALPEGEVEDIIEGQIVSRTASSALTDTLPTKEIPQSPVEVPAVADARRALALCQTVADVDACESQHAAQAELESEAAAIAALAQQCRDGMKPAGKSKQKELVG
jgi:hypothetical protein